MGCDHSQTKPKAHETPPFLLTKTKDFFYEDAPESVYEEFEFIREELKYSQKVARIYAFENGTYPERFSDASILTKQFFLNDLYGWVTSLNTKSHLLSQIKALCQGEFCSAYIQSGIEKASFLFFLFEPPMEIVGYACVIQYSHNKSLLLHSICTKQKKGYGKYLVERIKDIAALRKIETVSLESVPSAVGFYKKLGFKESGGVCKEPSDCAMTYTLSDGWGLNKKE